MAKKAKKKATKNPTDPNLLARAVEGSQQLLCITRVNFL